MVTNEERAQRYGTPIAIGMANGVDEPTITRAVMAVADAEQAELRAEVESAYADFAAMSNSHASLDHRAEMNRINWPLWRKRAEAAEAKVARVEALCDRTERVLCTAMGSDLERQQLERVIGKIRAALDGAE